MGIDIFAMVLSVVCVAISFEVRRRTAPLFPQSANNVIYAALGMTVFSVLAFLSPFVAWALLRDVLCMAFVALSVFLLYSKSRHDRGTL